MRFAKKSFIAFVAAMLVAIFAAIGSDGLCLAGDGVVRKNVLPETFRALTIGLITNAKKQVVYVDPGMCAMDKAGVMYVRTNAPVRAKPFLNSWEFAAVKLAVAYDAKVERVRVFDFDMSAEQFTYCPLSNNGKDAVDLTDSTKGWIAAEQVTTSKGKTAKNPLEYWGMRIWEASPGQAVYVSTKLIRVSEDGKGWVDGGIGVRRLAFEDGGGPAARLIVAEKLTFCDVDLSRTDVRFEHRGLRPDQTYSYSEEVRKKAGEHALQLVSIMPVRQWIVPTAIPEAGGALANSDIPDPK